MNKLLILCGMVFLGITSTPQEDNSNDFNGNNELSAIHFTAYQEDLETDLVFLNTFSTNVTAESGTLSVATIPYAELEDEIDLGFDTDEYLPDNFDPNLAYGSLKELPYFKVAEEMDMEVDTKEFLPANFNAYAIPENFMNISFIEGEEKVDLGFDTKPYLPVGFDAYEQELDLDSILFIDEEDLKYGYDTSKYLPSLFDPYSR